MIRQGADQPTGDDSTRVAPDVRMEADRLRHLSDPKLTAPIYGESRGNASQRRRLTFFDRLRDALLSRPQPLEPPSTHILKSGLRVQCAAVPLHRDRRTNLYALGT